MKTIMTLLATNGNPGDSLANLGARALFVTALKNVILDSWYLIDGDLFPYQNLSFPRFDYSLLLCTPWLWDGAHASAKYKILRNFTKKIDCQKRLAIGVGASFVLEYDSSGRQEFFNQLAPYWKDFDSIICRERFAYHLYSQFMAEDKIMLMPCPSYYASQLFGIAPMHEKDELLAFGFVSPKVTPGVTPPQASSAMAYQDKLVAQGIDVLTVTDVDYLSFVERYSRAPTFNIRHPLDIARTIATYSSLTSTRVHCCMPAVSLGLDVKIIPLDTRALTAISLGAVPIILSLGKAEKFSQAILVPSVEEVCIKIRDITARR